MEVMKAIQPNQYVFIMNFVVVFLRSSWKRLSTPSLVYCIRPVTMVA